jgi:precorrin-2 dehydrogenase/sirohydrochlorin ferrochelatase
MLPLSLDPTRLRLALIGTDAAAMRRLHWLEEAGARDFAVYALAPSVELARIAGIRLRRRWPAVEDLRSVQLVFIADVAEPQRSALVATARAAGAILHVEDAPSLTDSHIPAVLHRGALTVAVTTEGAAPAAAAEIKRYLATTIGPEWRERIECLRALRQAWRRDGADAVTVRRLTAAQIGRNGWLEQPSFATTANDRGAAQPR